MKIIQVEQGSPEWHSCKVGIPSASNFDKIVDSKGLPSKQQKKYLNQLAGEKILGYAEETYQNAAMIRGIELEEQAREVYSFITGNEVGQVGFCITEGKTIYGASPDGVIGTNGLLEIKCPQLSTHVDYLLANELPIEYWQQTQGQLLVTGRKWVDFFSYYPGLNPLLIRVLPDGKFIKPLKIEIELFCEQLEEVIAKIR